MPQQKHSTRRMKTLCVALILFAGIGCRQATTVAPENEPSLEDSVLSDGSFAIWRDRILTKEPELLWENLPWITTYRDGLEQAAAEDKPLLLWVMNGHPLGCT